MISFSVPGIAATADSKRTIEDTADDATGRSIAARLLESLCEQETIQVVVVDGDPMTKARPRFAHGHAYTPRKTIEGEKRIAARFAGIEPYESNVAIACVFYRASHQRIDVDNVLKAVLDAGTRAKIWHDDCQVTALTGILEYDQERPRSVIAIGEHVSSLTRGEASKKICEACGKKFVVGGHQRRETGRWCSRACRDRLAIPISCALCGNLFKKRTNGKYCSIACRGKAQTVKAQREQAAITHCSRGHEYNEANTYRLPDGRRRCRVCQAEAARAYRSGRFEKWLNAPPKIHR